TRPPCRGTASRRASRSSSSARARPSSTRSPHCVCCSRSSITSSCWGASSRRPDTMAARGRYRGGNYRRRSAGSRGILYATVTAAALWLIAPFALLFVPGISYQEHLIAPPFSPVPAQVTFGHHPHVLGLLRL